MPLLMSLTETFLMLKPTLSPGTASGRDSWCISTDLTSVERATGAKVTTMPGLITPVSTRPTGTVPIPPILYTSWRGSLRGLSVGLLGGMMESRDSSRVMPLAVPSGDGDEGNSGGVVADLLDEASNLLLDLLKPGLGVGGLGGVHLVDSHDELLDTQGVGKEGVLPGLTILGDTRLELTGSGGNDEDSTIGLAGS